MIRVRVIADEPLAHALTMALSHEPRFRVVGPSDERITDTAAGTLRPDVLVLAEPYSADPGQWVAEARQAVPEAKIVLFAITHRADGLSGRARADAVVDAHGGVASLVAAVTSVAGCTRRLRAASRPDSSAPALIVTARLLHPLERTVR